MATQLDETKHAFAKWRSLSKRCGRTSNVLTRTVVGAK